jgi:hypothetical protein
MDKEDGASGGLSRFDDMQLNACAAFDPVALHDTPPVLKLD